MKAPRSMCAVSRGLRLIGFGIIVSAAALAQAPQQQTASPVVPPASNSAELSARDEAATFKVNVRLVQVGVVVRDRQGHAVGNLRKEDFRLFDNGAPQDISRFSLEQPGSELAVANRNVDAQAQPPPNSAIIPDHYVAYIFDDVHLTLQQLMLVRNAATHNLAALRPTDRAAVFTTSGQDNLDFTDDQARLRDDLARITPHSRAGPQVIQCPQMTYYEADLILNKNDPQAAEVAIKDALNCGTSGDPNKVVANRTAAQALVTSAAREQIDVGDADTRLALSSLNEAVRRISLMPGQRTLVLVSPGFFLPDQQFELQEITDRALQSNIVINSLDARGLYTTIPLGDASTNANSALPDVGALESIYQSDGASLDADVLASLADATGGVFYHGSNDLDEGFRRVAAAPEFYYVLGFAPQKLKLDGKFHKLTVKLAQRQEFLLQARRGYYAPKRAPNADEEAKQDIEEALFSHEESQDLPVQMHTQFFKPSEDVAKLAVLVHLDPLQLHYQKINGRNCNEVTVVSALFDRNGRFISATQKVVSMRWKDETLESKLASGITLKSDFDVNPGAYLVRLVVRDSGGQLSAENGTVEIP